MSYFIFHTYMIGSYSPSRDDTWEENIRVYEDESVENAFARANRDALADQVEYETADGFNLSWRVHSVRLTKELPSPGIDGEEIFSRSLTSGEAQSLAKKIA